MFLVIDPDTSTHVFLREDPRQCGYDGQARVDVVLTVPTDIDAVADNITLGVPCLGVSPTDDSDFKVFRSSKDCRSAGFKPLGGNFVVFQTWEKYQTTL